jgi:hypothetical protein
MNRIYAITLLLFISGCTATYRPVSNEKILSQPPAIPENMESSTVIVKRNRSYAGSVLDARFYFDEQHIVTLSHAETYVFKAVPGKHVIRVKSLQPISMIPVPFDRKIEVELEPKKTYEYIFTAIPMAGINIDAMQ